MDNSDNSDIEGFKIHPKKDAATLESLAQKGNSWYEDEVVDSDRSEGSDSEDESEEDNSCTEKDLKSFKDITDSIPPFPMRPSISQSVDLTSVTKKRRLGENIEAQGVTADMLLSTTIPYLIFSAEGNKDQLEKLIEFVDQVKLCAQDRLKSLSANSDENSGV